MKTSTGRIIFFVLLLLCCSYAFKSENCADFINHDVQLSNFNKSPHSFNNANFQTGDLIFRDSKGMWGSFFKNLSQHEKKYSHVGFIQVANGNVWVCHYIDDNSCSGLKREELNAFADSRKCNAIGVYRFALSDEKRNNLKKLIDQCMLHPLPFDDQFDLNSDDQLYCTEWVSKTLLKAAGIKIPATNIGGIKYIAPDNLYLNSSCKLVVNYKFNPL